MKITQLYIYPIKSLRPTAVTSAIATKTGFTYDRRFMLLKRLDDGTYKNMLVSEFPEMTLFLTSIKFPSSEIARDGEITVTFSPPQGEKKTVVVPLTPNTADLERFDVNMHNSPTKARDMGQKYNGWFSSCFGFPVVFAYVGDGLRPVLFAKSPSTQLAKPSSWLSSITSSVLGSNKESADDGKREIAFQDCAHFLVVTEESLKGVSAKLPEGEEMDVTKFRPNIVLSGADQAWDEDFWGEVTFGNGDGGPKIELQHNCIRCKSINVDYQTGKSGTGKAGEVLKLMQSDRRVDKLKKYSPVFGRYGFLTAGNGEEITLGIDVKVTKKNEERSGFES
ncbi:hypothetical protein EG327_010041 [Venturia inaequalis]|uniref:MOSC domain-containing protein n=1 Tax=Venturia inaequalis TaxID=5025 RepID=A0A8H3VSV9_VENIN|nr:hypothetical protein EG327_010041 [Venturia inaequalis]